MPTIETIQASGGDYTSPQAWYDAHAGDITSDPGAPYIGEMAAETFSVNLFFDGSTTDADHYFHLRAQAGCEFTGDFDGAYPLIRGEGSHTVILDTRDAYTRLEHFCVGGGGSGTYVFGIRIGGRNTLLDGVGVYNFGITSAHSTLLVAGVWVLAACTSLTIRNCSIGYVWGTNTKEGEGAYIRGIMVVATDTTKTYAIYVYNNAVQDLTGAADGTAFARGIEVHTSEGVSGTATVGNNCIGSLNADAVAGVYSEGSVTLISKNNATIDTTGGDDSQDNITPADEFVDVTPATLDLHMKSGGQCDANGLNLIAGGYTDAPATDCDDEARPTSGAWSIGIDHHAFASSIEIPTLQIII